MSPARTASAPTPRSPLRSVLLAGAGVLAGLLLLEGVLRLLPVSTASLTGYHHHPELLTYPSGHRWTVATGWDLRNAQALRANNWGFVAARDFERNAEAVALVGDSYVESSMLAAEERPGAQLEHALQGRPVFALGTPGTALLDYAQRARWASEQFGVRRFVIWLERGDFRQTLCGSGNIVSRCLDATSLQPRIERQAPPSAAKRLLRHSALAQYLVGQLRFQLPAFLASVWQVKRPGEPEAALAPAAPPLLRAEDVAAARRLIDAALDEFMRQAGPALTQAQVVFVLDGARRAPWLPASEGQLERGYLLERLRALGFETLDLQTVYAARPQNDRRSLEVGPHDGHLNRLGVELVTQAIARKLQP